MNRKNENKPAYNKPSIELIAMDAEGSLLLTASVGTVSGGTSSSNAFGNGGTFNNRAPRATSAGTSSRSAYSNGNTFGNRN